MNQQFVIFLFQMAWISVQINMAGTNRLSSSLLRHQSHVSIRFERTATEVSQYPNINTSVLSDSQRTYIRLFNYLMATIGCLGVSNIQNI